MKRILSVALVVLLASSCKKDKYTSEPQIKFKSYTFNVAYNALNQPSPEMKLGLTDAEGDLGYSNENTYVYVKNITTLPFKEDSFLLPDLSALTRKNLNVEVNVKMISLLTPSSQPTTPYTDTLFFQVYVKDLAGNKSNVITTPEPIYLITP